MVKDYSVEPIGVNRRCHKFAPFLRLPALGGFLFVEIVSVIAMLRQLTLSSAKL